MATRIGRGFSALALFALAWSGVRAAHAEPPSHARDIAREGSNLVVPEALKPWVQWVETRSEPTCPQAGERAVCTYQTSTALSVDDEGGTFSQSVYLVRRGPAELPGDDARWPLEVRVDGRETAVTLSTGKPSVELSAGAHLITGRFRWDRLPDRLPLAATSGIVTLRSRGQLFAAPKREADGTLWLSERAQAGAVETDALRISTHRLVRDGVPLTVSSRFTLFVSGRPREVTLPSALLAGTRPLALVSSLPAELQKDGSLRIHLDAGEHRIDLEALSEKPEQKLLAPPAESPWPSDEIWVFAADEALRHVDIAGVTPLDPARTDLAPDFRAPVFQTYAAKRGTPVTLTVKRRGESEPIPNKLRLSRGLWLDLDGVGYTAHDELHGDIAHDFRLALAEGELGSARVDGTPQMISMLDKKPGVEVRSAHPSVSADLRFPDARSTLPAVAYDDDVTQLDVTLALPPGHRLLHAEGPDKAYGSWVEGWDLFDFFFVLLTAIGTAKLIHKGAGALALVTLVLTHGMGEAPTVGWVILLAGRAIVHFTRGTRAESLLKRAWFVAVLCMGLTLVPLTVRSLRSALYPQLEESIGGYSESAGWLADSPATDAEGGRGQRHMDEAAPMPASVSAPAEEAAEDMLSGALGVGGGGAANLARESARERSASGSGYGVDSIGSLGDMKGAPKRRAGYVSSTPEPLPIVQTGPGVPRWRFHSYHLQYTGPVQHDQVLTLWITPAWLDRLWSLLAALCPLALLAALVRGASSLRGVGASAAALLLVIVSAPAAEAQALPSPELLKELETRLAEQRVCPNDPLSVPSLSVRAERGELSVQAEVHAACEVAYQAPGPVTQWAPGSVRVDGKDASAVTRLGDDFLYVRLSPGIHHLELRGPLPLSPSFVLSLGDHPHRTTVSAPDYLIEGLRPEGQVDSSLSFRREIAASDTDKQTTTSLTQWVLVTRTIRLGVHLTVSTHVRRLSPATDDLLVRVPLLPGENVSQSGVSSDKGSVLVQFRRDQSEVDYSSTLADARTLKLTAATPSETGSGIAHPISERWQIVPSVLFHPRFSGIAPTRSLDEASQYAPEFAPYPGESLSIALERLPPAQGSDVTIDQAIATYTPGSRLESVKLDLSVRTSNGSTETLTFPKDAALHTLTVNGVARPERLKDGKLLLRLAPGTQEVALELTRSEGMGFHYQPASITLGRALGNVNTVITVPEGKWLLWSSGPAWGPAILFWGYMLAVVLFGLLLARVPHAPLDAKGFVLLGLGLTQVDVFAAAIVIGWLFALSYRERHAPSGRIAFNFLQIGLLVLTLSALGCLASAVQSGLVMQPDMQVAGNGSAGNTLRYYVDHSAGPLPDTHVFSTSIWVYRGLMLAWALWLAFNLLRWLRRGAEAFRSGGMFRPWFAPSVPVQRPVTPAVPPSTPE